ncbi:TPA: MbeD/MobD family mobilization/exclusion protein [Escherichia coli]|uniref:MbeD/MobD family mobilization/exclusion protein n=2 Tax=Enterobacterales TaxID=91347 RepID=UPI000A3B8C2D|nr:hypothetical protein DDJ34_30305 [Klebsiella oxytoca]RFP42060.1 hypothetical protein DDJ69_30570 [Klebsiella oxytoca]
MKMTELEKHLLHALKAMQEQFETQYYAFGQWQKEMQNAFESIAESNLTLLKQVNELEQQAKNLTLQVSEFKKLYQLNR